MCKKVKIYQKDNPEEEKILRKKSIEVDLAKIKSSEVQDFISKMFYFLEVQPDGVALAAPQIGINQRVFIVSKNVFKLLNRKIESKDDLVFINPRILKKSKKRKYREEGCFSVRWWYGRVNRFNNISIEAYNNAGVKKIWDAGDLLAQIFQHEIDHLDGILFCDKAIELAKISPEDKKRIELERKKMEAQRQNFKK